jgi:ethanolamine transporter EutH
MLRMKLILLSLNSTGFGQILLAVVESHDSIWLAIISLLMGIVTIGLGALVASFMKHLENHPGVTVNECKIKHDGLEKIIKMSNRYLETLIDHNGLKNKVKKLKEDEI